MLKKFNHNLMPILLGLFIKSGASRVRHRYADDRTSIFTIIREKDSLSIQSIFNLQFWPITLNQWKSIDEIITYY